MAEAIEHSLPLEVRAFSEREVMEALSASRNTVRKLRLSGKLPAFNIGRAVRYPAACVARFIAEQSGLDLEEDR